MPMYTDYFQKYIILVMLGFYSHQTYVGQIRCGNIPRFIFHHQENAILFHTHICFTYHLCHYRRYIPKHSTMSVLKCTCLYCTHMCSTYHETSRLHLSPDETRDWCLRPEPEQKSDNATGSLIVVNPTS